MVKRVLWAAILGLLAACSDDGSSGSNAPSSSGGPSNGSSGNAATTDGGASDAGSSDGATPNTPAGNGPTAKAVALGTCVTTADGTDVGAVDAGEQDKTIATLGEKDGKVSATFQCRHSSPAGITIVQFTASNWTAPGSFKGERVTSADAAKTQFVCVAQYGPPPPATGGQVLSSLGGECGLTLTSRTADTIAGAFELKVGVSGPVVHADFNLNIKK